MTPPRSRLQAARDAVNQLDMRRFRFWVQVIAFGLSVYGGYLAINLGSRLPFFACGYVQTGRAGVCYLLPLQHQLCRSWSVLLSAAGLGMFTGFLVFMLWFVVLSKGWCGFICPLGTLQDWLSAARCRLGIRGARYSQGQFRVLTKVKYVLLGLLVLIPLGVGAGYLTREMTPPFCLVCPARLILPVFTGDVSQIALDFSSRAALAMTALGAAATGLFLVGSFLRRRFFCFFCPLSALLYLLSKPALLKLKKDGRKCTRCGVCHRVCDLQISSIADDVETTDIMADDCTLCLQCVASCPEPGALKATFAAVPVFEATESGFSKRQRKDTAP
jgi:ferredoxin-type protein NapH